MPSSEEDHVSNIEHGDDDDDEKKKKRKKKHRHRDYDDDESDECRARKRRKHHDRKSRKHHRKRRKYSSSSTSSSSFSSDSESSSTESRIKKKHRKHKSKKKKGKHHKHRRSQESSKNRNDDLQNDNIPGATFGKYGVLKATDLQRMQRTFEVWMAEVKGIASFNGPKWELQKYFDEYREDFNTATLPHIKYYDYEKWEMEEYEKSKSKQEKDSARSSLHADEYQHRMEQKRRAEEKQREALQQVRDNMSREKVEEMKRQADLRAQMQLAFKMGDQETFQKLKERLAADP